MKTGANFGVDYCAYQGPPSTCHSEMCITVIDATVRRGSGSKSSTGRRSNSSNSSSGGSSSSGTTTTIRTCNDRLNWRHVAALTRVMPVRSLRCYLYMWLKLRLICFFGSFVWYRMVLVCVTGCDKVMRILLYAA